MKQYQNIFKILTKNKFKKFYSYNIYIYNYNELCNIK